MFQKLSNDAADSNVVRHSRYAGAKGTNAAHDKVDLHSRPRSIIKRVHDLVVRKPIDLRNNAPRYPGFRIFRLSSDHFQHSAAERDGCHEKLVEAVALRINRQIVEQLRRIFTDLFIRRQKPEVCVDRRSCRIVIAGG